MSPNTRGSKGRSGRFPAGSGAALIESLTQQEIGELLDAMLEALPAEARSQALANLGRPDTAQTVEAVLSGSQSPDGSTGGSAGPLSVARLSQVWSGLWKEWNEIVEEAAQEDGRYIEQDAHWKPPYFDVSAFVADLEEVAGRMGPLLQDAFQRELPPSDGFTQAVLEAGEEVTGALPEWMEMPEEGLELGPWVTACLLEWEWLRLRTEGQDGFDFAQYILDWEEEALGTVLDADALLTFFTQLPDADQQVVYDGLAHNKDAPPWQDHIESMYSHWHRLYMHYAETRAPEQYLGSLRSTIPQHWQNGLPVIKALLNEKDYTQSLQVVEETLESLKTYYHGGKS